MPKRDLPRYPEGSDRATCLRCGAPGNTSMKGGRLIPVKGLHHRKIGGSRPHTIRQWQHADSAFCRRRIPNPRRTPTSRDTREPGVGWKPKPKPKR